MLHAMGCSRQRGVLRRNILFLHTTFNFFQYQPTQYLADNIKYMKTFFKELFQYNNHFNQEVIAVLTKNPEKASGNCVKLLSHILNVHQIWNCKIQPAQLLYAAWEIHPVQDFSEIDRKNFEHSILVLDKFELSQIIQYSSSKGQVFNNSVRDILFQVINHSTYHRAQIATEFRQSGLEPLLTDYIYYKMK
jgi:uncharacterized damage-inducible protein DinB